MRLTAQLKVIRGLFIFAGALATSAYMAAVEGTPAKPESLWPTSWIGWMTAILFSGDILARGLGLYRWGQKGIIERLDRMEKHFDEELKDIREDVDVKITNFTFNMDQKMNGFTANQDRQMNGFGGRVGQVEDDITGINATMMAIQIDLSASKTDRANINLTLQDIKRSQDKILDVILRGK